MTAEVARRLGDEPRDDNGSFRFFKGGNHSWSSGTQGYPAAAFGLRKSVLQCGVSASIDTPRNTLQHESQSRLPAIRRPNSDEAKLRSAKDSLAA